ncbi:MAG: DUF4352 domain-containing protein [Chloroflexota bacterium]
MRKSLLISLSGLLILTACSSAVESVTPVPATPSPSPSPTPTEVRVLPTPASPGDSIVWENLQVTMDEIEISEEYINEYGSTRRPSTGKKFMWVHIRLENLGQIETNVPALEHFSVLYAATELKPIYGHRQGYPEYAALGPLLFPGQQADGWIRFDIPAAAELRDLRFVFLPESAQVGTSYSSPEYPYAKDKPTFVWKCEP